MAFRIEGIDKYQDAVISTGEVAFWKTATNLRGISGNSTYLLKVKNVLIHRPGKPYIN